MSEYSDKFKTSRNVIFSWHSDVCVCVCMRMCVCVRFSTFETPITHKRLEISIWNLVRQWSSHNPLIVTISMTIDARFVILWDFEFVTVEFWSSESPLSELFPEKNIVLIKWFKFYYNLNTRIYRFEGSVWDSDLRSSVFHSTTDHWHRCFLRIPLLQSPPKTLWIKYLKKFQTYSILYCFAIKHT